MKNIEYILGNSKRRTLIPGKLSLEFNNCMMTWCWEPHFTFCGNSRKQVRKYVNQIEMLLCGVTKLLFFDPGTSGMKSFA